MNEEHSKVGYLYILKDVENKSGWFKLGRTGDPVKRLVNYNNSFPEDRLVYTFISEKLYNIDVLEKELLLYTKSLAVVQARREWFKPKYPLKTGGRGILYVIIRKIEEMTDSYLEI